MFQFFFLRARVQINLISNKKSNLLNPGILLIIFFALSIATAGSTSQNRQKFQAKSSIDIVRIIHLYSEIQMIPINVSAEITTDVIARLNGRLGHNNWFCFSHRFA